MFSLLGSLLGFGTSFLPSVLKFFEGKRDQAHELDLLDKQMALQKATHGQRIEMAALDAEVREVEAVQAAAARPTGVAWVDALRGTVRPVITYVFMGLFVFVEASLLVEAVKAGASLTESATIVWDSETQGLFAAIISFWFGGRQFGKRKA